MSPWKSRWSWDRLVNAPTANRVPATRPSASAWLETSIATSVTPRSTITANRACRSGASGVVKRAGQRLGRRCGCRPCRSGRWCAPRPQPRLQQVRGRGLAARAGDAEHRQPGRRVAVDERGHRAERPRGGRAWTSTRDAGERRGGSAPAGSVSTAAAPRRERGRRRSRRRAPGRRAARRTGRPGCTSGARRVIPVTVVPAGTGTPIAAPTAHRSTGRGDRGRTGETVSVGAAELAVGTSRRLPAAPSDPFAHHCARDVAAGGCCPVIAGAGPAQARDHRIGTPNRTQRGFRSPVVDHGRQPGPPTTPPGPARRTRAGGDPGRDPTGSGHDQGLDGGGLGAHGEPIALRQVARDVVEQRRRARAPTRVVEHDRDDEPGVRGR